MSTANKHDGKTSGAAAGGANAEPDWAAGLKRLYDSVVEEPLPEAFHELLARLDDVPGKKPSDR